MLDWGGTPMELEEELVLDLTMQTNKLLLIYNKFEVPEISRKKVGTDYTMAEMLALLEVFEKIG